MLKDLVEKLHNMHKKMENISRDRETIFFLKQIKITKINNDFDGLINRQYSRGKKSVNMRTERPTETQTRT